jgi:hypothetical protein
MKLNATLAVSAVALLAACGGGSSGTSNNPTINFTTIKAFSDGGGVAAATRNDGARSVVIAPKIADVVAAANSVTQEDIDDIDRSEFPIVQVLGTNANIRQGASTIRGTVINVTIFEDLGGDSEVILQEIPNYGNSLMATGTPLGAIPEGVFVYSGTLGTGFRSLNPQIETGSFTMSANFNAGTFDFNGSTTSDTLSGSGFINTTSGSISANNINLTTSGTNRTASMYGNFHGGSAQGVSGLFHSNEASPLYSGGFVGSR